MLDYFKKFVQRRIWSFLTAKLIHVFGKLSYNKSIVVFQIPYE